MNSIFEKLIHLNSIKFFKFLDLFINETNIKEDILKMLISLIFNHPISLPIEFKIYKSNSFSFENQFHFIQFLILFYSKNLIGSFQISKDILMLIFKYLIENQKIQKISIENIEENLIRIILKEIEMNQLDFDLTEKLINFNEKLKL